MTELTLPPAPWDLRPYQKAALRAVSERWREVDRSMLVMATGTGKTTCFAEVLRRRYIAGRGRALIVAHRLELLEQAAARIRLGGLGAEIDSGESYAAQHEVMGGAPVVVATVQTLKGRRLERWPANAFGTIIVDEAHHATAGSYQAVLDRFPAAKILGVTATPDRGDGVAVGAVIPDLAYEYGLRQAIEDGFLAPLRIVAIDTPSIDLSTVRTTKQEHGRDLSAGDLAKQMSGEAMLHELAAPIAKESAGRQTIVFVPSVEVANELARVLGPYVGGAGKARALDGGSSKEERARVLAAYQSGEVQILVNCALFTEGFDAPETSCVAVARPTKSRALYAQMVGRGTRLAPGKTDCLVLDLAPANGRHSLVSPVDLMDGKPLPDDLLAEARAAMSGDDVLTVLRNAEKRASERAAKNERDLRSGHMTADVRYRKRMRDPFEELGIDTTPAMAKGPRATMPMRAALERGGYEDRNWSMREAKAALDALGERRSKGLCTIKQGRVLAAKGLRADLPFADAGEAMTMLKASDWKVTPEIAERFGAE